MKKAKQDDRKQINSNNSSGNGRQLHFKSQISKQP